MTEKNPPKAKKRQIFDTETVDIVKETSPLTYRLGKRAERENIRQEVYEKSPQSTKDKIDNKREAWRNEALSFRGDIAQSMYKKDGKGNRVENKDSRAGYIKYQTPAGEIQAFVGNKNLANEGSERSTMQKIVMAKDYSVASGGLRHPEYLKEAAAILGNAVEKYEGSNTKTYRAMSNLAKDILAHNKMNRELTSVYMTINDKCEAMMKARK